MREQCPCQSNTVFVKFWNFRAALTRGGGGLCMAMDSPRIFVMRSGPFVGALWGPVHPPFGPWIRLSFPGNALGPDPLLLRGLPCLGIEGEGQAPTQVPGFPRNPSLASLPLLSTVCSIFSTYPPTPEPAPSQADLLTVHSHTGAAPAPARQMVVRITLCPCLEGREDPENQPNSGCMGTAPACDQGPAGPCWASQRSAPSSLVAQLTGACA